MDSQADLSKKEAANQAHQKEMVKWREQKQKQAEKTLHKLVHDIDEHPHDYQTYYDLGAFLVELKNYTQAEEIMMKALGLFADRSQNAKNTLTYGLGNVYYAAGEYDKAIKQFSHVKNEQLQTDAYLMLAQSYMAQKNYKKAVVFGLTAQAHRRQDPVINQLIGDNLLSLGNFKEAGQFYDTVLSADDKNVKAIFNRGLVAMVNGEHYADYFAKAKQLNGQFFNEHQKQLQDVEKFVQVQKQAAHDKK